MLNEELVLLIEEICKYKSEKQNVEVKAAHSGCPTRLYSTLSSFSNQDGGGVILFGIDENSGFIPVGVYDLSDLQKKVTEQCNQMFPKVRAVFTVVDYHGMILCSAEIPSLDLSERPCYYEGTGKLKGSFVRVGDADMPMTDYEIYQYESFKKHIQDDLRLVERANMDMLDSDKLEQYISKMRINRPRFAQFDKEQAYEMLAIKKENVPTLAAVLNFGIYPQGYFPQLAITAIVVPGREIGNVSAEKIRFLDNKRIEGTLSDMLNEALAFCLRNMKVSTFIDAETGVRNDIFEYPLEAIREAVLNALIHRDYSRYTEEIPIQINFFSDRLEIRSPGGLYGRMTVEDLGSARLPLRNPSLAVMAEFLLNTENRYSGIPTIRREMSEAGLRAPVFSNLRNEFVVTLYNDREIRSSDSDTNFAAMDKGRKDILEFCRIPRTRHEIAKYLELMSVSYVVSQYVQPLVESGELCMTIPEKPKSYKQKYYTAVRGRSIL